MELFFLCLTSLAGGVDMCLWVAVLVTGGWCNITAGVVH